MSAITTPTNPELISFKAVEPPELDSTRASICEQSVFRSLDREGLSESMSSMSVHAHRLLPGIMLFNIDMSQFGEVWAGAAIIGARVGLAGPRFVCTGTVLIDESNDTVGERGGHAVI